MPEGPRPPRVLFVCLGNICRSPTGAAALAAHLAARGLTGRIEIDSAGTGADHVGEPPDERMRHAAARRGVRLEGGARQVEAEDFRRFDLIVAMDRHNLADLAALAPAGGRRAELRLFSDFLPPGAPRDVPDPYFGGAAGFERVLDMVQAGSAALAAHLLGDAAAGGSLAPSR